MTNLCLNTSSPEMQFDLITEVLLQNYEANTANYNDKAIQEEELSILRLTICILLFIVIIFTIIGNIFVLMAPLFERRLRTTFIYFILNLAITDLLVALTAMDFYTIDVLLGKI